jgi:hypothetical protein
MLLKNPYILVSRLSQQIRRSELTMNLVSSLFTINLKKIKKSTFTRRLSLIFFNDTVVLIYFFNNDIQFIILFPDEAWFHPCLFSQNYTGSL